ncbi:MAG: hypothetical protein Q6K90_02845 [Gloeomargarita sp. HHBFW_bins_162]
MEINLLRRRECGAGWAVDVSLPRVLTLAELEQLAASHHGTCRVFHTLVWIDLPWGRVVASTVTTRLTLRLHQHHDRILDYLHHLPL